MYYIYRFSTQNYILFKISASGLFLKYSNNFANFSLDILIKYILIRRPVWPAEILFSNTIQYVVSVLQQSLDFSSSIVLQVCWLYPLWDPTYKQPGSSFMVFAVFHVYNRGQAIIFLGGGGDSNIKKVGMLVENFEIHPNVDQSGCGSHIFWPLIEVNLGEFFKKKMLHFFACNPKRDLEG